MPLDSLVDAGCAADDEQAEGVSATVATASRASREQKRIQCHDPS